METDDRDQNEETMQLKLRYSEALIRRAIWAFWWRVTGWRYFAAFLIILIAFIYFLVSGDRSWWVGVFASILCLSVIFTIALYVVHYRGAIAKFRRMKAPEAIFEAGRERFKVTSDYGSSELSWDTVTEVWRFREFWLLFFSRAQFITIPLSDIDSKALSFILSCAKFHGAKVS